MPLSHTGHDDNVVPKFFSFKLSSPSGRNMPIEMKISTVLVVSFAVLSECQSGNEESFLEKFRFGLELIQRLLTPGPNFSTLFSETFREHSKREENDENFTSNLFNAVIKTIAGNEEEAGILGLRISVLVAKMISDAFPQTRRLARVAKDDFSPLSTLLRQTQIRNLMTNIRDPDLTEKVVKEIGGVDSSGGECVRLLICKMSPFVRGMQNSLNFFIGVENGVETGYNSTMERHRWAKSKPIQRMFQFLPGMNEFLENGDVCDERHPLCVY